MVVGLCYTSSYDKLFSRGFAIFFLDKIAERAGTIKWSRFTLSVLVHFFVVLSECRAAMLLHLVHSGAGTNEIYEKLGVSAAATAMAALMQSQLTRSHDDLLTQCKYLSPVD